MSVTSYLFAMAAFYVFRVTAPSLWHAQAWSIEGLQRAFGNRQNLLEPSAACARAKRAGNNTVEGLVVFALVYAGATAAGATHEALLPGVSLFVWARAAHWAVYIAGLPYVRTVAWGVSLYAMVMMAMAAQA